MSSTGVRSQGGGHRFGGVCGALGFTGIYSSLRTGAVVLAVLFWLTTVWMARDGDDRAMSTLGDQTSLGNASTSDCSTCHPATVAAWRQSAHAQAATSEYFQARLRTVGTEHDCMPCHAPQPMLRTGIANPILARPTPFDEGVSCASCHATLIGVAAFHTRDAAPCKPRASPGLSSDAFCGSCHRSIYDDVRRARVEGLQPNCVECHMLGRTSEGARPEGHSFQTGPLGHSVGLTVRREDGLLVEVSNSNSAHAFPGERHNRVLMLKIEYFDGDEVVREAYHTIRAVIPFNTPRRNDDIGAGQTYAHRFEGHSGPVRISLLHKQVPWILHDGATVVRQVTLRAVNAEAKQP